MRFNVTPEEMTKATFWLAEHNKECPYSDPSKQGAAGGRLTYQFTPTHIGTVTKVICACGAECDVTDYDMW